MIGIFIPPLLIWAIVATCFALRYKGERAEMKWSRDAWEEATDKTRAERNEARLERDTALRDLDKMCELRDRLNERLERAAGVLRGDE